MMEPSEKPVGERHPMVGNIIDLRQHFEAIRAQALTVDPHELLAGLKAIEQTMVKLVAALHSAIETCEAAERPLLAIIGQEIDKLARDIDSLCDAVMLSIPALGPR